jgi:hypothetical protein
MVSDGGSRLQLAAGLGDLGRYGTVRYSTVKQVG